MEVTEDVDCMEKQILSWPGIMRRVRDLRVGLLAASFLLATASTGLSQSAPRDVVLETLREFRPKTPLETIRAVENLLNIGEIELAKSFLKEFLANPPSETALVQLHGQMGSAFFSKLAIDRRFSPEGQQLASLILSAATRAARDPKQLRQWALDLESDKYDTRRTAIVNLQNAGADGVVAVLQRAADAAHQPAHQAVTDALWSLGKGSPGPLLGAARCDDPTLRWHAISALARSPAENRLALFRWQLDPSADSAIRELASRGLAILGPRMADTTVAAGLLRREVEELLAGTRPLGNIDTMRWTLWYWTPKTHTAEPKEFPRRVAELIVASQYAEDLLKLEPDHETNHELYWTAVLAATRMAHPYPGLLKDFTPDIVTLTSQLPVERLENVIRRGLEHDLAPAAIAACEVLGYGSSAPALGTGSAVGLAAAHPDRRLRFAAARLAMQWAPQQPYAAASDVWEEVLRALHPGSGRSVLIYDSAPQRGDALGALCREFQLEPIVVTNGQSAVRVIQTQNAVDAILIHQSVSNPTWSEMWQQLQSMPIAANIPTALLYQAEGFRESSSERIAVEQMGTKLLWYPVPSSATGLGTLIRRMLLQVEVPISEQERMAMAHEALNWVQKVAADPQQNELYDLGLLLDTLEEIRSMPELVQGAIPVLASLPSERAQQTLRKISRSAALPEAVRNSAERALRYSTDKHGMRVSDEDVLNDER